MKVLLGITGGIAAYKCPDLVRRLIDQGAQVRVVLSHGARQFVTPIALQAVSGHPVRSDLWDEEAEAAMSHIELARWADKILIAPATANIIAELAHGHANDLLTTVCLATEAPIELAPAMNRLMWANPATQANVALLTDRGMTIHGPAAGEQACGETGTGRMLEPMELAEAVCTTVSSVFDGQTVVISAGPTREPLDPVRYLTNRSSGKMGYALARAFREAGATVKLVSGPVNLAVPTGVEHRCVETAAEMLNTVLDAVTDADVFIGAAAIADYSPVNCCEQKIKKSEATMSLDMVKAPDTLASVAALPDAPFTVGFAAETNDVREYALGKLERKKLKMIVANRVGKGLGFDAADNKVCVYWSGGEQSFPRMNKLLLARELVQLIAVRYREVVGLDKITPIKGTVA